MARTSERGAKRARAGTSGARATSRTSAGSPSRSATRGPKPVRFVSRRGTEDAQHEGTQGFYPGARRPRREHVPGAREEPPAGLGQPARRRRGAPEHLEYEPEGGSVRRGWASTRPPTEEGAFERDEFGSLGGGYGEQGFAVAGPRRRIRTPLAIGPFAGVGPRGYQRSDERIREEVCEALTEHGHIDPSAVDVEVARGEVRLTGEISSAAMRGLVEDVAGAIPGVTRVRNALVVRRAPAALRGRGRVGTASARIPRPRSGRGTS